MLRSALDMLRRFGDFDGVVLTGARVSSLDGIGAEARDAARPEGRAKGVELAGLQVAQGAALGFGEAQNVAGAILVYIERGAAHENILGFGDCVFVELAHALGGQDAAEATLAPGGHEAVDGTARTLHRVILAAAARLRGEHVRFVYHHQDGVIGRAPDVHQTINELGHEFAPAIPLPHHVVQIYDGRNSQLGQLACEQFGAAHIGGQLAAFAHQQHVAPFAQGAELTFRVKDDGLHLAADALGDEPEQPRLAAAARRGDDGAGGNQGAQVERERLAGAVGGWRCGRVGVEREMAEGDGAHGLERDVVVAARFGVFVIVELVELIRLHMVGLLLLHGSALIASGQVA